MSTRRKKPSRVVAKKKTKPRQKARQKARPKPRQKARPKPRPKPRQKARPKPRPKPRAKPRPKPRAPIAPPRHTKRVGPGAIRGANVAHRSVKVRQFWNATNREDLLYRARSAFQSIEKVWAIENGTTLFHAVVLLTTSVKAKKRAPDKAPFIMKKMGSPKLLRSRSEVTEIWPIAAELSFSIEGAIYQLETLFENIERELRNDPTSDATFLEYVDCHMLSSKKKG